MANNFARMSAAIQYSIEELKGYWEEVDTGHWQGVSTDGKPDLVTREILDLHWVAPIPGQHEIIEQVEPNWPWCENHFQERVSRVPSNPGVEYQNWPWWHGQVRDSMEGEKFTHTYQERFWPKKAGDPPEISRPDFANRRGIRYQLGDLDDVVELLLREPYTRQAYFPIFFSEDTGAVHGGRIPCSLGYHFLLRGNRLHCWYDIRSCDAVRHFRDDLYLACRLVEWVLNELFRKAAMDESENTSYAPWLEPIKPGNLYFTAHSFHAHKGDWHLL